MRFLKLLIAFLIVISIPFIFVFKDSATHKNEISIATGGKGGGYYASALKYKKILEEYGVNLKIITTSGSIDAQKRLLNKEVDFAFVQGGTEMQNKDIKALANIDYEPIWIFCFDSNITTLPDLIGRRISIGKIGSGIYPVAKNLLNESGIDANNSDLLNLANSDAAFELQAKSIDVMFYVASANAKLVKKLLSNSEIKLMNFKHARTYRQYFLNKNENYQILKLEPYVLDLKEKLPTTSHTLLAKNSLIATIDESDEMIRLFMKTVEKVHGPAGLFNKEGTFPNSSMLAFEQHSAASEFFKEKSNFYEEHFDFWTAQSLNKLHEFALLYLLPALTLFAFFVEVVIPSIDLYTRRKVIKWYDKINQIDTGIETLSLEEAKRRKIIVKSMLHHVRNQDDIPATHMEEFYTLQNQISSISDAIEMRIRELRG